MRSIHLVRIDKVRPAVILTRRHVLHRLSGVVVAPITRTIRGLDSEVAVGKENGLDHLSVISCDTIQLVPVADIGRYVGSLNAAQEARLRDAVLWAFDLH